MFTPLRWLKPLSYDALILHLCVHVCRPVLTASDSADLWDSGSVGTPCVVSMAGGSWRLYYSGKQEPGPGAWSGIGMALNSEDSQLFEGIKVTFKRGRQA